MNNDFEEKALIVSAYIRKQSNNSIASVFESLNIPFKKKTNEIFWLTNEADLEYLYHDFCKISRGVLIELHPDKGGDHEEFVKFAKIVAEVKKAFQNHGVGRSDSLFQAIELEENREKKKEQVRHLKNLKIKGVSLRKHRKSHVISEQSKQIRLEDLTYFDKWQNCFCLLGYLRPEDILKAGQMILNGYGTRETAKIMNFSRTTMARLKKLLLSCGHIIKGCPCGRPSGHQGNCHHRLEKIGRDHLEKFIENGDKTRFKKGNSPSRWKIKNTKFNF